MDSELKTVENYLHHGDYPDDYWKGEAKLRRKCRNNFKLEAGILYYRPKRSVVRMNGVSASRPRKTRRENWSHFILELEVL